MKSSKLRTKLRILIPLATLILLVIPTLNFARKPAVEPVTGISIDHIPPADPKNADGFPFDSKPKDLTKEQQAQAPASNQNQRPKLETGVDGEDSSTWFLLFLVALPVAIWFVLMKNIEPPKPAEVKEISEVKPEATEEKEEEDHDDDYQLPKAS